MRITSRGVLIATFLLLAACGRGEDTNNQNQTTVTPAPDDGMPDASTEEMGNEADMAEGSDMPADMPVDMTAQPDMTVPMSGARLLYDPASEDFFSLPFPSDARLDAALAAPRGEQVTSRPLPPLLLQAMIAAPENGG